jgi:hypothetical protein
MQIHGSDNKFFGVGRKLFKKRGHLARPRHRWEDIIEMHLKWDGKLA